MGMYVGKYPVLPSENMLSETWGYTGASVSVSLLVGMAKASVNQIVATRIARVCISLEAWEGKKVS